MTAPNDDVARIVQEFLERRARGEAPTKEECFEKHPELREALAQQFETIEALDRLVVGKGPAPPRQAALGDFRILREIGRGGMGVVFLAEQSSLHRHVALKVLSQPLAQAYHHFERFRREAEIAARLHHPNLVAVYSVGESQGYPYFAMEYVRGVTLGQVLAQLRERTKTARLAEIDLGALVREMVPADIDDEDWDRETPRPARPTGYFAVVAGLVADLAEGLDYAHGRGVIHRDVKPQNILIDRSLTPQLADFGLAKDVSHERLSITGDLLGTPYYMSPELAMAGRIKVDHRTDVYSLGVTLYELLTLRVPFSGSSSNEVLRKIVLEPVPFPRRVNPSVPRDLQVIALKAMEKDPDQRYASAAELAEDLRRFLRFDPITARPPGPLRIASRFVVRHRIAAAFAAVALVAGLGMAGTGMLAARQTTIHEMRAHADRLAIEGAVLASKDELQLILERYGDVGGVQEQIEAVEAKRQRDIARASEEFDVHFRLANEGYLQHPDLAEACARELERLGANSPELLERIGRVRATIDVPISSVPAGAMVTAFQVSEISGEFGQSTELGRTPLKAQLRVGSYLIVVDGGDAGFAEHVLKLRKGSTPAPSIESALRATDQVVQDMVPVPAGRYRIGRNLAGLPERFNSELTERFVEQPLFYIDRNEVSNEQYAEFCAATNRKTPLTWIRGVIPNGAARLPVTSVTWGDAEAFAEWVGKRLPTEIEWEAACRGLEGHLYSWGDDPSIERARVGDPLPPSTAADLGKVIRMRASSPMAVDDNTEDRTPSGILNMIGNVREWTLNPWVPRSNVADMWWSVSGRERTVRGASTWTPSNAESVTACRREPMVEEKHSADVGFRCAKSVRK